MRDCGARAREGASEVLRLRAAVRAEFRGADPVRGRAAPRDPPERKYVLLGPLSLQNQRSEVLFHPRVVRVEIQPVKLALKSRLFHKPHTNVIY